MALMLTPQRIIVVRHGERLDNVDYRWTDTADRPYDPPLTEKGEEQARETGKRFVGKEIHSIITSPFLRCLQTAQLISEVLRLPGLHTCNGIVDILNGSCGIREQPVVPASNIAELGINVASTGGSKLPKHPERTFDAIKRFRPEFSRLANAFWPHNIVIVTHGVGVQEAILKGGKSKSVFVDYCGYVELTRSGKDSEKWTIDALWNIDEYF